MHKQTQAILRVMQSHTIYNNVNREARNVKAITNTNDMITEFGPHDLRLRSSPRGETPLIT